MCIYGDQIDTSVDITIWADDSGTRGSALHTLQNPTWSDAWNTFDFSGANVLISGGSSFYAGYTSNASAYADAGFVYTSDDNYGRSSGLYLGQSNWQPISGEILFKANMTPVPEPSALVALGNRWGCPAFPGMATTEAKSIAFQESGLLTPGCLPVGAGCFAWGKTKTGAWELFLLSQSWHRGGVHHSRGSIRSQSSSIPRRKFVGFLGGHCSGEAEQLLAGRAAKHRFSQRASKIEHAALHRRRKPVQRLQQFVPKRTVEHVHLVSEGENDVRNCYSYHCTPFIEPLREASAI